MHVVITPTPLSGTIEAIASKSDAHRHLIGAALSDAPTEIRLNTSSDDIDTTTQCLRALGATIENEKQALLVHPLVSSTASISTLDCAESGSTLRFMLPVACACTERAHFTGRGRLPQRPLGDLVSALRQNGVELSSDHLPLSTQGRLQSGTFSLPGNVSSQYITGLLLALPLLEGKSQILLTTQLESLDYVHITLEVLKQYGIVIEQAENRFIVPGAQQYRSPGKVVIEGDWSNAAFFLAAGAIGAEGTSVTVTGLTLNSPQGDRRVVDFLKRFGAEVNLDSRSVQVSSSPLHGCTIDIGETPDLLPVLAVVAACAEGETHFTNGARLRLKESDRLETTATLLRSLGGEVEELPDGLIVRGKGVQRGPLCHPLSGGTVSSFNDHRIAMAAAVAAIACAEPVTILDAAAVNKSYPAFYADYQKLGGTVDGI